jgi:hypothetical protein
MQAFFLQTGIGDVQCAEAPQNGVLIQTPEGQGKINFTVNNVDIVLGSTAFLQAQPDDFLYAYVVEGEARVSAFETQKVVPAGAVVAVPVDSNLSAAGPPNDPEPYAADDVMTLPVSALEQEIVIAESADTEAIVESNSCTVVANEAANVRSGPGTNYPILSTMGANAERDPVGQAAVDGGRWWKLSSTAWVDASVVEAIGNCDAVAIASIPPAPTSMSIGQQPAIRGTAARFNLWDCNGGVQRVISGSQIEIFISHGGGDHYASLEDARNANLGAWLSVNGTPYNVARTSGFTDGIGHHYTVHFDVGVLPDGTYYAVGQISSFPIPSCVVVVG